MLLFQTSWEIKFYFQQSVFTFWGKNGGGGGGGAAWPPRPLPLLRHCPRPSYKAPRASIPSVTASLVSLRMWCTPSFVVASAACTLVKLEGVCGNASVSTSDRSIRNNSPGLPVAEHFTTASHSLDDIMVYGLNVIPPKKK